MTVYVDAAIHPWRGKLWCHLFSEDLTELHDFASRLGMRRGWFQEPPKASWPHYDITKAKRATAVQMGAREACHYETMIVAARLTGDAKREAWAQQMWGESLI